MKPPRSNVTPLFPNAAEAPQDATPKTPQPREPIKPLRYALATFTVTAQGPSGWGLVMYRGEHRQEMSLHLCHADGEEANRHAHGFLQMLDHDREAPPRVVIERGADLACAQALAKRAAMFAVVHETHERAAHGDVTAQRVEAMQDDVAELAAELGDPRTVGEVGEDFDHLKSALARAKRGNLP